jgi:NADH:ubiquinone oxidoreductase subunit 5 (subunit L)/multisubunit Na+/H+ antiporter MnhA subunit
MSEDPELPLFMAYLSLFTFFMLVLVTAGNFVVLFLGWEGVGLSSYLLINFWHTRSLANKAAMKAIIVNKLGDILFMIAIVAIFFSFGSFDFYKIFPLINEEISNFNINLIALCLLGAAVAKSAQLGLHTWLPDAMEGPSPVSALIHAATMVTARHLFNNKMFSYI